MTLGIMLASGDSFKNLENAGQDSLFKNFYIKEFSKNFKKVLIFSYANEKVKDLPENVILVPNKYSIHRYFYGILMPFLNYKEINECDVLRAYHLFGTLPAIISNIIFGKKYVFNYAYDYVKFAQIDKKTIQVYILRLLKQLATLTQSKIFIANKVLMSNIKAKHKVFLPNGVDTKTFNNSSISKNKVIKILSVGRLEKQKNYNLLIDALYGLNAQLVIVGSGVLKKDLVKQANKKHISLNIIDTIPHNKIKKYYQRTDIFALPSIIEGSPKVLLEAMASERAVIGSDVEGINEVIVNGQNGILVKPNTKSLRKGLKKLILNGSLRKRLATNARKTILNNYDLSFLIKREVSELKTLYEKK